MMLRIIGWIPASAGNDGPATVIADLIRNPEGVGLRCPSIVILDLIQNPQGGAGELTWIGMAYITARVG